VLSEPRGFVVRPSAAGGFEACAAALSRLLTRAMDEGCGGRRSAWRSRTRTPVSCISVPTRAGTSSPRSPATTPCHLTLTSTTVNAPHWGELGWGDPVPDLSGDDDVQPRNHTRSWPIQQLPLACRHTLLTLAVVYAFHEDDPLQVSLDPFA
jgi:hypothetical protein